MSFNENNEIDLQTALVLADNILSRRSPKANFLLNLGIEKSRGKYLKLCFSYLRWVDDIVDNFQLAVLTKRNFINRQLKLISDYSSNISVLQENTEESFLYYFIQYGLSIRNDVIINSVRLMIEGLEMDVQRTERDGVFSESEMNKYISKMSKSFFDVTASFILPEGKYPYQDVIVTAASTKILMIRDLVEDIKHGYINITRENLNLYNLNATSLLRNNNLKLYLTDEIKKIIKTLLDEAETIKQFPMRMRLFNYYNQIYSLPKIFRLIAYEFNPINVLEKRLLRKNLKTYFTSFLFGIRLFIIEFL